MNFLMDARMADGSDLHGIARYIFKLVEWGLHNRPEHKISVAAGNVERWRCLPVEVVKVYSRPFSVRETWEFFRLLRQSHYHHVHFPSLAVPLFCPKSYSMTAHDLIPWHYPSSVLVRLYLSTVTRWNLRHAAGVISGSYHAAGEVEKYLGYAAERVRVIYHGGLEGKPASSSFSGEPYILCVANPRPHKNLSTLLAAFRGLEDRCRLLVVCPDCPQLKPLPLKVERRSGLSDGEMRDLYAKAQVVVVPSIYEGFGLSALEAMCSGTPVVSSSATSLPEVVGEAALLFDPGNADELREKILQVLDNPQLAADLRQRGLQRAQHFSWEKSARAHWDCFESWAAKSVL